MLEVNVISEPSASIKPDRLFWDIDLRSLGAYDANLIKPALLIADKTTLITFREDMKLMVSSDAFRYIRMPMQQVGLYAAISRSRAKSELQELNISESILAPLGEAEQFFDAEFDDRLVFAGKYDDQIGEFVQAAARLLRARHDQLSCEELQVAVDCGVLDVAGWIKPSSDLQFEIWSYEQDLIAKLAVVGISETLNTHNVPMLDPGAELLLSSTLGEDFFETASPEHGLDRIGSIAGVMVAQFPGLLRLSVAEILDLRRDLDGYLPSFRSEVERLSREIEENSGLSRSDLVNEIKRHWFREIAPVVQDIEQQIARASYPRQLLAAFAEDRKSLASLASSVTLAAGTTFAGVGALVPSVAAAAIPFIHALNELRKVHDDAKKNKLYFLYGLKKGLRQK